MHRMSFPHASVHQEKSGLIQLVVSTGSDDTGIYFGTVYKKRLRLRTLSKPACARLHPITLQAAMALFEANVVKKMYWLIFLPHQQKITIELRRPEDLASVTAILTQVFEANGLVVSGGIGTPYAIENGIAFPSLSGMLPADYHYWCEGGREALVEFLKETAMSLRNQPDEELEKID